MSIYYLAVSVKKLEEGLEVAQPKRRWSKARTGTRRSTWKLDEKKYTECSHCHEPVLPHTVCSNCGYYDGKEVVSVKKKED